MSVCTNERAPAVSAAEKMPIDNLYDVQRNKNPNKKPQEGLKKKSEEETFHQQFCSISYPDECQEHQNKLQRPHQHQSMCIFVL